MPRTRAKKHTRFSRAVAAVRAHARDHFIPHSGNNHVPHVLQHRALFAYGVFLILLKLLVLVVTVALPARSLLSSAITAANIVDLTNAARRSLGVTELRPNPVLSQAATAKAEDMVLNQYFAHTSPDGKTPWSWIKGSGYDYRYAGENLAVHFTTAEGVTDGWLASPSHRENISSAKFTEVGIGIARGMYQGVDSTFVVQMFGTPQETAPAAPTANTPPPAAPEPTPPSQTPSVAAATPPAPDPVVTQSSVTPVPGGYSVVVTVPEATPVAATVGTHMVPLTPAPAASTYSAIVPSEAALGAPAGEPIRVLAAMENGQNTLETIGWLAPEAQTQDIYAYPPQRKSLKILGFINVEHLDDQTRKFYIYVVLFLSGALLISLLAKVRMHHPKVVGHTLFLVGLALVLFII